MEIEDGVEVTVDEAVEVKKKKKIEFNPMDILKKTTREMVVDIAKTQEPPFFYDDIDLMILPTSEDEIHPWIKHHSFHLQNTNRFPPLYLLIALLHICGCYQFGAFILSEESWKNLHLHYEWQKRYARYVCPFYKTHAIYLLFVPWTFERFTKYVRHLLGKYYIPLYIDKSRDYFYFWNYQLLYPEEYRKYLNHILYPINAPFPDSIKIVLRSKNKKKEKSLNDN